MNVFTLASALTAMILVGCASTRGAPAERARPTTQTAKPSCPPLADSDGDGVPDICDRCPFEAGVNSADHPYGRGCPYIDVFVEPADDVDRPILFGAGTAVLDTAAKERLADYAAKMLKMANKRFIVVGHASTQELDVETLSERRAAAVVAELTRLGVPASSLEAHGAGAAKPDYDEHFQVDPVASRRAIVYGSPSRDIERAWDAASREVVKVPPQSLSCEDRRPCARRVDRE